MALELNFHLPLGRHEQLLGTASADHVLDHAGGLLARQPGAQFAQPGHGVLEERLVEHRPCEGLWGVGTGLHVAQVDLRLHLGCHPEPDRRGHVARIHTEAVSQPLACAVEDVLDVGHAGIGAGDVGRLLAKGRPGSTKPPARTSAAELVEHHAHRAAALAGVERAGGQQVSMATHAAQQWSEQLDRQLTQRLVEDLASFACDVGRHGRWHGLHRLIYRAALPAVRMTRAR